MHLIAFDLDGTLADSEAFDGELYVDAVHAVLGLDPRQLPIASSSDAVSKVKVMRIAERRALPSGGAKRRTYFGDSPYDKEASRNLGYDFIAIGERVKHRPRYSDFRETESILEELELISTL